MPENVLFDPEHSAVGCLHNKLMAASTVHDQSEELTRFRRLQPERQRRHVQRAFKLKYDIVIVNFKRWQSDWNADVRLREFEVSAREATFFDSMRCRQHQI
jgi:hypothetical protein